MGIQGNAQTGALPPRMQAAGALHRLGPQSLPCLAGKGRRQWPLQHTLWELNINVLAKRSLSDSRIASEIKLSGSKALHEAVLAEALRLWAALEESEDGERWGPTHLALALGSQVVHFFHVNQFYPTARHGCPNMACM